MLELQLQVNSDSFPYSWPVTSPIVYCSHRIEFITHTRRSFPQLAQSTALEVPPSPLVKTGNTPFPFRWGQGPSPSFCTEILSRSRVLCPTSYSLYWSFPSAQTITWLFLGFNKTILLSTPPNFFLRRRPCPRRCSCSPSGAVFHLNFLQQCLVPSSCSINLLTDLFICLNVSSARGQEL